MEAKARAILSGLGVEEARLTSRWRSSPADGACAWCWRGCCSPRPTSCSWTSPRTTSTWRRSTGWSGFLADFEGAFVVVSHDRYFLNRMVRAVAELSWKGLAMWPGTYDDYLEAKEAADAAREKAARLQAKEIARVERFIERFRYKASKASRSSPA